MEVVEGVAEIDDIGAFVEQLGEIADSHGVTAQAFDANYVVDRAHLRRAVDNATRAMARDEMIADDRGVEILLYAAGRRQINRAFEMGVSTGECPVVICVVDCDEHDWDGDEWGEDGSVERTESERNAAAEIEGLLDAKDVLGEYDRESVCEFFEITETELDVTKGGISDLVRERVALLVVER
ncbi:KEOPS complex subunit Cgi121 [Halobacteriaceae archaeon SHR40]|uniref:KEOPS complex subunit Cgi121 n=1 Tax=Halovenus amylolytica TaxID=2500550 RepID=UPI000FE39BB7